MSVEGRRLKYGIVQPFVEEPANSSSTHEDGGLSYLRDVGTCV